MSRILTVMPSAKQIKARKAFVRLYAKKGKRKKSRKIVKGDVSLYGQHSKKKKLKELGYSEAEIDKHFDEKWDKKMKEFLYKENNES